MEVLVLGVFTSTPMDNHFWETMKTSGCRCVEIITAGRDYLGEYRNVRTALEEFQPHLLHTHGYRPDVVGGQVARRIGLPILTTVHGFTGGGLKNRMYEWLQRRSFRHFSTVVAVSEKLRGDLLASGLNAGQVRLIRNAWQPSVPFIPRDEARRALGLPLDARVAGWVGRLSPEKGPEVMLDAWRSLAQGDGPPGFLSFIGDGDLMSSLQARLAGDPDLPEGGVRFHGMLSNAGRYLQAFDTLAISSWTEGTPMVLLEAMAAGVPVVTTAVGGIPDVLGPDEGFLVPAGDTRQLAAALRQTLAGGDSVRKRATAARARVERDFAVGPWANEYLAAYRSVCELPEPTRQTRDAGEPNH
jgi:glycosyltransferase involved in cell wall biosynthesis